MTGTFNIDFPPNPVQKQFIESRGRADLFSSRVGEGKSAGLVWSIFYHTRHNPGARWALIRDTWENLQRTTMQEFFKWFPPGVMGTFHQTKKVFTWAPGVAEGEVIFLGLDDKADASKLQSLELAGFAMDEPSPAAESGGIDELVFDIGMTRLRQPGMSWYAVKLAQNNPDEHHWTYRRFVDPGTPGFVAWQTSQPENERNLPVNYYAELRRTLAHRPDLLRRFVEGKYGFQSLGRAVTPEWSDDLHLALGLYPHKMPLHLLWDFGLNPTCIVTQVTPARSWNILDAVVGDDMGVEELLDAAVVPMLASKYKGLTWSHIGDPAGTAREQSSSRVSAVRMIQKRIGGKWTSGPRFTAERVDPLRAVLRQTVGGVGMMRVDRSNAAPVWQALRGGWFHHISRTGIVSLDPVKNAHSHPGDAMGYGAAVLYPLVARTARGARQKHPQPATFFGRPRGLGIERPDLARRVPPELRTLSYDRDKRF